MPAMVVPVASMTGRRRLTAPCTIVSKVAAPSFRRLSISSISTMQFLISIPERLRKPKKAGKVKVMSVASRPSTTPHTVMGTDSQITRVSLTRPNISRVISNITASAMGIFDSRVP